MRKVTNKKELITGIETGERHFEIDGITLLLQCELASKFNSLQDFKRAAVAKMYESVIGPMYAGVISEGAIIGLSVIAVVGAISIIAVLKGRKLRIRVKNRNGEMGEVVVE